MNFRTSTTVWLAGLLFAAALSAPAAIQKNDLDQRIQVLTAKFEALQRQSDERIPAEVLNRAQGIILLDRTKAGFGFAYQGGNGVALVRDASDGSWGPAAFVRANETSFGFQAGGEHNFLVILLMTTNATGELAQSDMNFGGEARGTAGDSSAGVSGNFTDPNQPVLTFSDHQGFFGGAALKMSELKPDSTANQVYYGHYVSMSDILFHRRMVATPATVELIKRIREFSQKP